MTFAKSLMRAASYDETPVMRRLPAALARLRARGAALVATVVAFAVGAAFDWMWELAVVPALFFVLVGATGARIRPRVPTPPSKAHRAATTGLAVVGGLAILIPLAAGSAVRDSEAAVRRANLPMALEAAGSAMRIQPDASTPRLQRALVLERLGALPQALAEARIAATKSPADWRPWVVIVRLAARSGDVKGAVAAVREGRKRSANLGLFR